MVAVFRLPFLCIGRGGGVVRYAVLCFQVTAFVMLMDALGYFGIAVLAVLVSAGRSLAALGVAAVPVMLSVVFAQAAAVRRSSLYAYGRCCLGAEGKYHYHVYE